jgi:hypothetical protein
MTKVPSLDEVEAMSDDEVIELESKLVEATDNGPRAEDGPEPAQDESPGLENQED